MESRAPGASERESIDLVEKLWDLACKHLLGLVSGPEYRQATKALLDEFIAGNIGHRV